MPDAVVKMTVANPAKIVSPTAVNAAVETAEGRIEGEIPAANIAAGAVTEAKIATGAVTTDKLGAASVTAAKLAASAGVRLLGITQAVGAAIQDVSSSSWTAITGLALSVTLAAGERVLLFACVNVAGEGVGVRITRGGSPVVSPTSPGVNRIAAMAFAGVDTGTYSEGFDGANVVSAYLDAPGSAGTFAYAVQARCATGFNINRGITDNDNAANVRAVSSLLAVKLGPEVA